MALTEQCVKAVKEWHFQDAADCLDGRETEQEARWIQSLATMFANVGKIEGELGTVIEAAVAGVLSLLPKPLEMRANRSYVEMADRYNRMADLTRACIDHMYEYVRLPSDLKIPRKPDYSDVPVKMEYVIARIDAIRSMARASA